MPIGTKTRQPVVQFHANPPTHAHDHALAVHRRLASLEMLHNQSGQFVQPFPRTRKRF